MDRQQGGVPTDTLQNNGARSASLQQDVQALVEAEKSTGFFKSIGNTAKDIWGSIGNTYTKYTDKDIVDASAYAQLQNIIRERENKQFEIATKDLSEEGKRIEFDNISSYYYDKEGQLLNKAIAGNTAEEQYSNLSRINNSLYSGTLSDKQRIFAQQDEAIDKRLKQQTTEAANAFSDGGLISNKLDNTRKSLQQSLAAETSAFKRGQLQFLAELEKSNATEEQKDEVANMFNEALSLRDIMNGYALEGVMQGLVGSELTSYVTNKLGPTNTAYAVELENKLFNRAESIQSTALLNNGSIFRGLVGKVGVGTYAAAQGVKGALNVGNTTEERFAKDFSEIELSDKSGLHYAFHWTLDNSDDIFSQLAAGIGTGGVSILGRRMATNGIMKATRLEDLLQNTPTGKKIMENKVINGRYGLGNISDELTASIFVNPAFNTAMKDVNTQERMIADAMIDLALLPVIQPIFDKIGAGFGRVATLARESSIGGTFALNDAQLINELNAMGLKPDEASNVLRSIQDYLKLTNNNSSNRDVLSFAKTNIARLREEGMVVNNGSVYILNQYQAKAVNPLNISVEEYLPTIEQGGSISLKEDSIEAIDLDNIFKKINTTPVYSSPEKTITALISSSGGLNTSDVRAFVNNKDNKKLIDTLYKTLVSAKDKASKARKLESINAKTSPLQEIKDMSGALEIVLNNLRKPQDIITVYAPFQDPYGKTRFESKQIRASNVSIENYQFISNETGEDTQVFLQGTFYDTIADGSFGLSEVTYKFLRSGELSPGILDKPENSGMLDSIIDELHKVFGNTNIQRDGTGDINILKKPDGGYKLSFGNRQTLNGIIDPLKKVSIDYKGKNASITLDEDTVRLGKINDLLFFRVMAHPSNQSTEGMADIINGEIINLKNDILLGSIDATYSRASINQTLSIAKGNVRETVRGMFTDAEFKEFNKVLDESLFTDFSTSKLAHLTDVASGDRSIALGNILEGVGLRAAERFKAIRSSIYKVKQSDLPTTNKKEIISGLLLGKEPINLFKYMNVGNKGPTKAQQKALGIKAYDPIFKVSKEQTNTFIENIIAHKEKFREYSFDEKESMRTLYREKFNGYANAATEAYSHQVLRNSLNDLSYSNKIEGLKTTVGDKEFDSTFIERMNTAINEEDSIGGAILKVNEIMETVPNTVPKTIKNQLLKIKDFLDAKRIETLQATPMYLDKMIERVNTIGKIYADTAQARFEGAGVYSEASQTSGGDNIINKSLNKLFDPYTKAQVYNEDVAKAMDQYINTMILEPAGHTGDTLFGLQQLKDRDLIDVEEYSNRRLTILNVIKDIIYPTANIDSFDVSSELTKKIQDRDTILFGMINHIKDTISQSSIAIIKDDKTIVKGVDAAEIITKDMSPWDLINNFDVQIRKGYVDGYKIDASETLTPASVIDTLEETRTIFNHIHNAGSPKRYKPIIVNGGAKWHMKGGTRDEYKYANNIYQYVMARYKGNFETKKHPNGFSEKIVPPVLLDELKIYLDEIKDTGTTADGVQKVLYRMLNKDETPIPGYINNLNIGDKDTLGIFSPEYLSSETDGVKGITDYFRVNDKRFQEDFIKELGVSKEDGSKLAYKDVAKRLSAIVSNEQTMVPGLEVPVRNFVIEDIPSGTYHIKKDSITDIDGKPFADISEIVGDLKIVPDTAIKVGGVETTFRRYLLDRLKKELDGFDENFSLEHFDNPSISDSIVNYLNTAYTDGASYLHPDQVKFMSKFVSYIGRRRLSNGKMDHNASTSIKFHHYKQDEGQSYLFKTLWNPYSKDMLDTINKFYPSKNSRLVGNDSTKLKNYGDEFVHFIVKDKKGYTDWMGKPIDISKLDKSRYEIVKEIPVIKEAGIERRLKGYLDSNTKHDRVASTSSSVESQTNEFTKQGDVRIHPAASTMIANNKIRIAKKDLKALEDFLANEGIPTANLFDKADEWTTFTLNEAGLDDTILPHTERYIKDEIQKIKNKITSPRFDNAGFQGRGLPRMEYKPTSNSKAIPIPDDVVLVHKDRFEEIKEHLIYVDNEYYAVSYRNPVPNAENITLNKVKIDYSMEALDSVAFSPFNINVNKQGDFDGDAFNIMYINKDHPEFISGLASTFGAVLSIEEARGNIPGDLIAKIYSDADPMEYRQEIYDYIVKHIKENKDIRQVRVPVQQAAVPVSSEKLRLEEIKNEISDIKIGLNISDEKLIQEPKVVELIKEQKQIEKEIDDADTLVRAIQNSITGKDAIATVDSFIRTADIVRKYAQEWKYASLGYTGITPQEVEAKFREDISNAVTKYTKNLNEYNTTVLESPDVASNIAAAGKVPESIQNAITDAEQLSNEIVDAMISEFPKMLDNPDYKGIVAGFEQMTLDLAKTGADKLPDGWENTIVKQILTSFENIDVDKQMGIIKTLQAISASTNQVYEKLGKFDVLNYYDPEIQGEIVAIGDHRRIAETLKEGILRIRDAYKPISQLQFDRRYFGLQNQEVLKDIITQGLGSKVSNSRADTMYAAIDNLKNVKWRKDSRGEYTTIPGVYGLEGDPNNIPKGRDKPASIYPEGVSFSKTRFQMIKGERVYLNGNDKGVKGITPVEINGIKVYRDKIDSIKLELLEKHNATASPNIYLTSKMSVTPDNIIPILTNGYSTNKPIWADGKFENKKLPNGLYRTTISHKYKEEFIRKVLPQIGIQYNSINGKLINAIRLTQNMKIDNSLLTPEENLDKGLWSIVFKDPEIKKLYDKDTMLDSATYTAANNLTPLIKSLKTEQLPAPQRAIVEKIQRELGEEIPEVNISEDRITITTDKEMQTLEVDGKVYQVDTNNDGTMSVLLSTEKLISDSKRRIESIISDDSVQESIKPEVKDILSSIIIPQHKVPFEFNKVVGFEYGDYFKLMDTVDNIIGDVADNHSFIMANKAIKVFDDLMLRNQELKNNTSVHLYEGFTELQKSHKHINKTRRRDLDNDIFESLLKRDYDSYIKTVNKQDEKEYVKDMYNFITTDNPEKQSLRQLYVNMGIRFDSLLDKASKKKNGLNDLINSSIIEDIVNLRHKTEKIAFYEAGIYNPKDFVEEYRKRTVEKGLPYVKQTAEELGDAIFEYDVLAKNMVGKTIGLMRNTSYSVSLGAFSWLSGLAGIAMGAMQIPSEFLRVSAFTKGKYKFTELDDLMSRHKLLQSVGIEPTADFGPFELKPIISQKVTYDFFRNIAKLAGPDVPDNWFMDRVIKNSAMIISNPLMLTDVVVDPMRKTSALSNVLDTLGYKTIQDFDVALQQMEPSFRKEFLNKVRLASEQKYHEISGGVTAGSYLWKETSLARKKGMMPFNYLMNWTYHIVGTAIGDASMTAKGMGAIMSGDFKNGSRLIRNSNLMNKVFLQGLVGAALYAKIQSSDGYEGEFNTRKDMFEFVRTINSTMVGFDIFFPTKSIQAAINGEGGIIPKLTQGVGATLQSMFREFDLAGIAMNELQTAHNVPGYDYIDGAITAIVNKGTKGLMYNKSLERESAYPEFVRRALVDQMFGADTPNFDEQLARELNDITSATRIQLLWDEKPWAVIPELLRANNVVRNLTGLMDSKNTFSFYDAQVQELQKTITSPEFQDYYKNPELMIQTLYESENLNRVWTNATSWTETYGEIDWLDNNILESELAKYIPEVSEYDKFGQLTEHMIVGELIEQYGKDAYKNLLSDGSEQRRYAKQLMAKISDTTSPAKIPYVISLLLQKEQAEFYKNNPGPSNAQKEAFQALTLAKYSDLIQGSVPLMSQIVSYQALEVNPDLKDYLLGSTGFVQQHIADRVAGQIIISNAYQKEEFHASYVAGQLGNIMRRTRRAHQDGKINDGAYKTALLDLYTTYDDRLQESNLSPEQKLEIRTALYKALEKDAHVLQESPELQSEYESARINLIHKLYKFTGDVEKYQREAEGVASQRLSKAMGDDGYSPSSFGRAYRNMNQIRQPFGGGGSGNSSGFSSDGLKKSGNQAQGMLQQPGVNFPKVFNPAMNPYARAEQLIPFGFRFTPQQNRFLIEEFRNAMQPQMSRDLINNNEPREGARIIRRRKRRAENVESRDRLLGFQNNPGRKSLGLMKDLPGNRQ